MCIKWIGLVGKIGKRIVNLYITHPEPCPDTRLVNPNFALVGRILVIEHLLEIVDTGPDKKYIVIRKLQAYTGVNAYRLGADHGISLAIERNIEIGLSQQVDLVFVFDIVSTPENQLGGC